MHIYEDLNWSPEKEEEWEKILNEVLEEKKRIREKQFQDPLTKGVILKAEEKGADLVAITTAEKAAEIAKHYFLWKPPNFYIEDAKSVIVLGMRIVDAVIRTPGIMTSRQNILLNILLNEVSYWVARYLQDQGFDAVPVYEVYLGSSIDAHHTDVQAESGIPLKLLAQEGGMGTVGIGALLITPEYGPRIRLGGVITNAELVPGWKLKYNLCFEFRRLFNCNRCINACEVHAIRGDGYIDWEKCWEFQKTFKRHHGYSGCNVCQYVCPIGKYTNKLKPVPGLPKWKPA
ncbi:MAG: epoxyqueuosine reductase [Desulfurococcales archaeon]|nr:epoxyqueuosine reductase [Desulfurococcales archaeon]